MKKLKLAIFCAAIVSSTSLFVDAQTWNSNAGGYNTGYGTVYGSFGLAMATQNIYNSMQMNMQRTMMRSAMIKKWGLAAVEKAEREAKSGKRSGSSAPQASGPVVAEPPPAPKYLGKFKPVANVDTAQKIADALGETAEEKALLKQIVNGVKEAFEKETAAKGWKNNVAGAMTFFLVSTSTIYHDGAEPDDTVTASIYEAVNRSIDEIPDFAAAPNKDKQAMYELLIGFAAIPLATYAEGKQNGNADTVQVARQLSGKLIELVLKTDPDKMRFDAVK